MLLYNIDYKSLIGLHQQLDSLKYGHDKLKYGEDPAKITKNTSIDCSAYVHYVLNRVTNGKIVIGRGPLCENSGSIRDWAKKQGFASVKYSEQANLNDFILRLAYLPPKTKTTFGHIWLVLNSQTLESHGSKGVNRRKWNDKNLAGVTDCFNIARASTHSGPVYRTSAKLRDPKLQRLLNTAMAQDKTITLMELTTMLHAVSENGKLSQQETHDLKVISEYPRQNLSDPARALLKAFIKYGAMVLK